MSGSARPLTRYDNACRALAEARSVDEVKDVRDKAIAMAAYARQARNRDLEADAIEIRPRATRRLDQLRQAQKANKDVHQIVMAPVAEHSRKPDEIRTRIERLVPGPYLELFARRRIAGWTTWGNEIATSHKSTETIKQTMPG